LGNLAKPITNATQTEGRDKALDFEKPDWTKVRPNETN
jgi:hypothetical protein